MIIIKYIILFIIFLGVAAIGNFISKKYRNRVNELKDFKEFLGILESKIKFTYEPLGEALEDASKIMNNSISAIIKNTSLSLKSQGFKQAWENEFDLNKINLSLKDEDINIIKGLGNMLRKN